MRASALTAFLRYHDAVRAERYRITVARFFVHRPPRVFVLDKPAHGVAPGWSAMQVRQRFAQLDRLHRQGYNLYYTPLHPHRAFLLLDDLTRKAYHQVYHAGYRPAAVIESSPGNYQALFLVSSDALPHRTLNTWVRQMNQQYGDPHLAGAEHAHRAPGFTNQKPAYRRPDGSFPPVRLVQARFRYCPQTHKDLHDPAILTPASAVLPSIAGPLETSGSSASSVSPEVIGPDCTPLPTDFAAAAWPELPRLYRQHAQDIVSRYSAHLDYSRVDSMIAVRLRLQGYSPAAIAWAVAVMGPQIRPPALRQDHHWPDYAQRTAAWAFSPEASRQLSRLVPWQSQWDDWLYLAADD
jgi:hypothetical protein